MSFEPNESYAHQAAKNVVAGWLRTAAMKAGRDEVAHHPLCGAWRVMPWSDDWGVTCEYPIAHDGEGVDSAWRNNGTGEDPTADELIAQGRRLAAVLDVALISKGHVFCGIEVVHKHDVTPFKATRLHQLGLRSLVVLPSAWVLGQVGQPRAVPSGFYRW